jgi:hypothetical protein
MTKELLETIGAALRREAAGLAFGRVSLDIDIRDGAVNRYEVRRAVSYIPGKDGKNDA